MRYGDINGDRFAGRRGGPAGSQFPRRSQYVVDKIVKYDETERAAEWQRRALFVADNSDGPGDFAALSEEIITGYLPSDLTVTRAICPILSLNTGASHSHEKDDFSTPCRQVFGWFSTPAMVRPSTWASGKACSRQPMSLASPRMAIGYRFPCPSTALTGGLLNLLF